MKTTIPVKLLNDSLITNVPQSDRECQKSFFYTRLYVFREIDQEVVDIMCMKMHYKQHPAPLYLSSTSVSSNFMVL